MCVYVGIVVVHKYIHKENLPGLECFLLDWRRWMLGGYLVGKEAQINQSLSPFLESH
jgi:hypothetical protein